MTRIFDLWSRISQNKTLREHFNKHKDKKEKAEKLVAIFTAPKLETRAVIEIAKEKGKISNLEFAALYEKHLGMGQFLELPAALNAILPMIKGVTSVEKAADLDPSQTTLSPFIADYGLQKADQLANLIKPPKRKAHKVVILDAFLVGSTSVNGFPGQLPKEEKR